MRRWLFTVPFLFACSGANAGVDVLADVDSGGPAPGPNVEAGTGGGPIDAGQARDGGGSLVNELPSPQCHDLTQRGPMVEIEQAQGPAPKPNPLASITPGRYIVTSAVEYGSSGPSQKPSRTTVVFTPTRQYYLSEEGSEHAVITLDWKLDSGRLIRTVRCSNVSENTGQVIENRIDASTNGFTIYVPSPAASEDRLSLFRYERIE